MTFFPYSHFPTCSPLQRQTFWKGTTIIQSFPPSYSHIHQEPPLTTTSFCMPFEDGRIGAVLLLFFTLLVEWFLNMGVGKAMCKCQKVNQKSRSDEDQNIEKVPSEKKAYYLSYYSLMCRVFVAVVVDSNNNLVNVHFDSKSLCISSIK